jgi:UDP-arabinose 4-epimerase
MRVLVTGGSGYIGSAVSHALKEAGLEPVSLDVSRPWGTPPWPFVEGDVNDADHTAEVMRAWAVEAVVHLAGFIAVGESTVEPLRYWRNNVGGVLALTAAMAEAGVGSLVFSSTAAVYGEPEAVPISEHHALRPQNPYGRTKLTAELLFRDLAAASDFRFVALRYFNAAGALESVAGERHQPETHLIPLTLGAARTGTPLQVFGTDYATPDGTAVRDYIHVADLAAAHVAALRHLASGGTGGSFNLANSRGYSVLEVIRTTETVLNQPVPWQPAPRRPGDPAVLVGDSSRAREILGWAPRHESLDDMVASAALWEQRWHNGEKRG